MKFNLSIDIDVPVASPLRDNEIDFVTQEIFDRFVNFAICQHLVCMTKWMAKEKDYSGDAKENVKIIIDFHDRWSEILREAAQTMKVTKLR